MFLTLRDGKRMYYETHSEPEKGTVLLIHGLGADHEMWKPQIERYPEEGYRVIVPDVRGHGKTDSVGALAIPDWSHDLRELLDHLSLDTVTVIGVSMGGVIAQQFAVDFPERTGSLVLSDTFCELQSFGEKMRGAFSLIGLYPFYLLGKEALAKAVSSAHKTEQVRMYFQKVTREARLPQIILSRKAINQVDLKAEIANLEVPTLVMTGIDFGEGFVAIGRKVAEAIPGAEFVSLEGACDPSNLVNPEVFDRNVLHFLEATERIGEK